MGIEASGGGKSSLAAAACRARSLNAARPERHNGRSCGCLQCRWKRPHDKFLQLLSNGSAEEYCESSVPWLRPTGLWNSRAPRPAVLRRGATFGICVTASAVSGVVSFIQPPPTRDLFPRTCRRRFLHRDNRSGFQTFSVFCFHPLRAGNRLAREDC